MKVGSFCQSVLSENNEFKKVASVNWTSCGATVRNKVSLGNQTNSIVVWVRAGFSFLRMNIWEGCKLLWRWNRCCPFKFRFHSEHCWISISQLSGKACTLLKVEHKISGYTRKRKGKKGRRAKKWNCNRVHFTLHIPRKKVFRKSRVQRRSAPSLTARISRKVMPNKFKEYAQIASQLCSVLVFTYYTASTEHHILFHGSAKFESPPCSESECMYPIVGLSVSTRFAPKMQLFRFSLLF